MAPNNLAKQPPSKSSESLDPTLKGLLEYCRNKKIYIAPSVAPRRAPGRGVGIYATRSIKIGQKLMSVPTKSLFTTASIPDGFFTARQEGQSIGVAVDDGNEIGNGAGDELSVHAKLAAYFAFGEREELKKYAKWMATWPKWEDFTAGMPVFWDNSIEVALSQALNHASGRNSDSDEHDSKRRKIEAAKHHRNGTSKALLHTDHHHHTAQPSKVPSSSTGICRPFIRSPALDGRWRPSSALANDGEAEEAGLVSAMAHKIAKHVLLLTPYFPELATAVTSLYTDSASSRASNRQGQHCDSTSTTSNTVAAAPLQRFLHAWALINTRCFYYHAPHSGRPAPTDPNECMALCASMDLFNHSAPPPLSSSSSSSGAVQNCRTKYDSAGFSVTSRRNYAPGEEVLLSYGAHGNDTLWAEYGFFLGAGSSNNNDEVETGGEEEGNTWDEVSLDTLLLPHLSAEERRLLEAHGYLGQYTLRPSSPSHNPGENASEEEGGVCYRTQVLACLKALDATDKGEVFAAVATGARDMDTLPTHTRDAINAVLRGWMHEAVDAAADNIAVLRALKEDEMLKWLGWTVLEDRNNAGGGGGDDDDDYETIDSQRSQQRLNLARSRRDMCLRRWGQIQSMARKALKLYERPVT